MCTTCGCGHNAQPTLTTMPGLEAARFVPLNANPSPAAGKPETADAATQQAARAHGRTLELEARILEHNDRLAQANREWLAQNRILALNLVSGPGAGKTTLLERTIRDLAPQCPVQVIEGDQETQFDAERIRATGAPAVQINTGTGCHLEADMLGQALQALDPASDSLVLIENVGNLVCPALFDLGESAKVVILSVTEGADKPLKYPHMFRASSVLLLNKMDLLPHVDFDVAACVRYARQVNPDILVFPVSATRGDGMDDWYGWLQQQLRATRATTASIK